MSKNLLGFWICFGCATTKTLPTTQQISKTSIEVKAKEMVQEINSDSIGILNLDTDDFWFGESEDFESPLYQQGLEARFSPGFDRP